MEIVSLRKIFGMKTYLGISDLPKNMKFTDEIFNYNFNAYTYKNEIKDEFIDFNENVNKIKQIDNEIYEVDLNDDKLLRFENNFHNKELKIEKTNENNAFITSNSVHNTNNTIESKNNSRSKIKSKLNKNKNPENQKSRSSDVRQNNKYYNKNHEKYNIVLEKEKSIRRMNNFIKNKYSNLNFDETNINNISNLIVDNSFKSIKSLHTKYSKISENVLHLSTLKDYIKNFEYKNYNNENSSGENNKNKNHLSDREKFQLISIKNLENFYNEFHSKNYDSLINSSYVRQADSDEEKINKSETNLNKSIISKMSIKSQSHSNSLDKSIKSYLLYKNQAYNEVNSINEINNSINSFKYFVNADKILNDSFNNKITDSNKNQLDLLNKKEEEVNYSPELSVYKD